MIMITWDLDFTFCFNGRVFLTSLRWFNFVTNNIQLWCGCLISPIIWPLSWKGTQITFLIYTIISFQLLFYLGSHKNHIFKLNIVLWLNHISYLYIQSIQELWNYSFSILHNINSNHQNLHFLIVILHTCRILR